MGDAAELIMDVEDDENWNVAGDTFGQIFQNACVLVSSKSSSPSPRPLPSPSPSPDLFAAKDGAKNLIDIAMQGMDDVDSEDMRSTVGGASNLAEDSCFTFFQEDFGAEVPSDAKDIEQEVRSMARSAILQGYADGRLDSLLAEASGQIDGNSDEIRAVTRDAVLQGLADGRLDALLAKASGDTEDVSDALVPQPPAGGPPVGACHSPARNRRLLAGSTVEKVMDMISDADRKVGSLQVLIAEKEQELKNQDQASQQLTENIQFVRSDLEHLSTDLQWHEVQVEQAEERWGKVHEDRRALALKLDEMRLKELKDEWPTGAKNSQTARSWTSTVTGGATTAIESAYSGWNTERSVGVGLGSTLPAINAAS